MADREQLKERVCAEVDRLASQLIDASHQIHARPEVQFEEHHACEVLCALARGEGLDPAQPAYGMETAFAVEAGGDGPVVGICCEYDALPGIGHACGHNIIGAAGLGAGLAAARVAADAGGRVRILGTPAEEGGGGKIRMAVDGAFDGLFAALMVHPAGADLPAMDVIAVAQVEVDYHGLAAHASAAPERGRNALDAAVLGYMGVAALRQHIGERERIHGVITDGGAAPNVVPERASSHWLIRSPTLTDLGPLKERVMACLEAGAAAAGCRIEVRWHDVTYAGMRSNGPLLEAYAANSKRLGRALADPTSAATPRVSGSTDMANVSHLVPSIHPMIAAGPPEAQLHTVDFARHARSSTGDRAVVDGAKLLALTAIDVWVDENLRQSVRADFEASGGRAASVPGI